jgi:hypothetical protein
MENDGNVRRSCVLNQGVVEMYMRRRMRDLPPIHGVLKRVNNSNIVGT